MAESPELRALSAAVARAARSAAAAPTSASLRRDLVAARERYAVAKSIEVMRGRLAGIALSSESLAQLRSAAAQLTDQARSAVL